MSHGLFSGPTLFVQRRILETLLPRVEAEMEEKGAADEELASASLSFVFAEFVDMKR